MNEKPNSNPLRYVVVCPVIVVILMIVDWHFKSYSTFADKQTYSVFPNIFIVIGWVVSLYLYFKRSSYAWHATLGAWLLGYATYWFHRWEQWHSRSIDPLHGLFMTALAAGLVVYLLSIHRKYEVFVSSTGTKKLFPIILEGSRIKPGSTLTSQKLKSALRSFIAVPILIVCIFGIGGVLDLYDNDTIRKIDFFVFGILFLIACILLLRVVWLLILALFAHLGMIIPPEINTDKEIVAVRETKEGDSHVADEDLQHCSPAKEDSKQ